jgi:hypothetical protein
MAHVSHMREMKIAYVVFVGIPQGSGLFRTYEDRIKIYQRNWDLTGSDWS